MLSERLQRRLLKPLYYSKPEGRRMPLFISCHTRSEALLVLLLDC